MELGLYSNTYLDFFEGCTYFLWVVVYILVTQRVSDLYNQEDDNEKIFDLDVFDDWFADSLV